MFYFSYNDEGTIVVKSLAFIDYCIVAGYLLVTVAIGIVYSRKASRSTEDYFLGKRSMPWWAIGISLMATSFASDTPLAITEMTRQYGLQRLWWPLSQVMTLVVSIFLFSRLWRRCSITTDAEFYELRYDGKGAIFLRVFRAFFAGIITNLIIIGWVTFGMASVISTLTNLNQPISIGICLFVALVPALLSGFYGAVAADVVQFVIATVSMIVFAIIAVFKIGGFHSMLSTIAATPGYGAKTLSIFPDFTVLNDDLVALIVFLVIFWWSDANGFAMQRISGCKNERHAVLAMLSFAIFQTCRNWIWALVALVSIVLFPILSGSNTDTTAYPMVINQLAGAGMKGLLLVSFLGAYMSTVETMFNWGSSYITTDIYQRFIKRNASQEHYIIISKISVVLLAIATACIVPFMKSVTGAWEFLALLGAGGGIIQVARWFWWRVNVYTEITSLILGMIAGIANPLISDSFVVFGYTWTKTPFVIKIALLTGINILISIVVMYCTPSVSKNKLEIFYRRVRPGGCWSVLSKKTRDLPGKTLSWATLIDVLGGILLCYGAGLSIGYLILLKFKHVAFCIGLTMIGAIMVSRWYQREVKHLSPISGHDVFEKQKEIIVNK